MNDKILVQKLDPLEDRAQNILADVFMYILTGFNKVGHIIVHQLHDHKYFLLYFVNIAFFEIDYMLVFVGLHYLDFVEHLSLRFNFISFGYKYFVHIRDALHAEFLAAVFS
jgi:hypothetical protein